MFSTLIVPRDRSLRMAIGLLTLCVIGLAVNAGDKDGTVGPRVCGALMTVIGGGPYVAARLQIKDNDGSVDPALGTWAGLLGLVVIMAGCVLGTRTDRAPDFR
jgi:hypothetical protein